MGDSFLSKLILRPSNLIGLASNLKESFLPKLSNSFSSSSREIWSPLFIFFLSFMSSSMPPPKFTEGVSAISSLSKLISSIIYIK